MITTIAIIILLIIIILIIIGKGGFRRKVTQDRSNECYFTLT